MSIIVSHLRKKYGLQQAVDDISFSIGKGEVVGFLGPNGAGKSTTMKMITGYLQPDEGDIEVCGQTVSANDISFKNKIGYLPEANPLYADMYVREYLHFMAGVHKLAHPKHQVESVIQMVGLVAEASKKTGQLSKGYKQRVGLAAALIHDPEVLILDEPTSGLDPNQIIEIRELIRQLGEQKTILFSSHIMQEVEAICQRAIIINKGKIVADEKLDLLKQQNTGRRQLAITFKETIDAHELEKELSFDEMEAKPHHVFVFHTSQPDELKKQLMEFSLRKNKTIVSLQDAQDDLESVFRTLTA